MEDGDEGQPKPEHQLGPDVPQQLHHLPLGPGKKGEGSGGETEARSRTMNWRKVSMDSSSWKMRTLQAPAASPSRFLSTIPSSEGSSGKGECGTVWRG